MSQDKESVWIAIQFNEFTHENDKTEVKTCIYYNENQAVVNSSSYIDNQFQRDHAWKGTDRWCRHHLP